MTAVEDVGVELAHAHRGAGVPLAVGGPADAVLPGAAPDRCRRRAAAATDWALDRLGVLANPLAGAEDTAIAHP